MYYVCLHLRNITRPDIESIPTDNDESRQLEADLDKKDTEKYIKTQAIKQAEKELDQIQNQLKPQFFF